MLFAFKNVYPIKNPRSIQVFVKYPITPPNNINHIELTWVKSNKHRLSIPKIIVTGSISASFINFKVTTSISATAEEFTPSKNAPNILDFLNL